MAAFLADQATQGTRASTMTRRLTAIRYAHRLADHATPTDTGACAPPCAACAGPSAPPPTKRAPATAERIRNMANQPETLMDRRDRGLLLIGFASAFRRSELVALDVVAVTPEGLRVRIHHSKADQEGAVVDVLRGGLTCPVEALQA